MNSMYSVYWNGIFSDKFPISNGVKQGGVLSSILFTLYMEPLINQIIISKQGCHIGDKCAAVFVYADDIILLTPTRGAMQNLLDIAGSYADNFGLKFNLDKCKLLIFSDRPFQFQPIYLSNVALQHVHCEKHLGHMLSDKGDYIDFMKIITDLKAKANVLHREFYFLDWKSKSKLFNANCTSFYGCQLVNLSSAQINKICTAWRMGVKCLLDLDIRTHSVLLPHVIGSSTAEQQIHSRIVSFIKAGLDHDSDTIAFFFKNCIFSSNSYICRNVHQILYKYDISMNDFIQTPYKILNRRIKQVNYEYDWRISIIHELMLCRDNQMYCGLTGDKISYMLQHVCTV